jgi:8-oxo-dGTP pyrophosphatase MutT (NUDIX family)
MYGYTLAGIFMRLRTLIIESATVGVAHALGLTFIGNDQWADANGRIVAKTNRGRLSVDGAEGTTDMSMWVKSTPSQPPAVNNVLLKCWIPPKKPADWKTVDGIKTDLQEPTFECPTGWWPGAGTVILEPDNRVWIVEPRNHYYGYTHTLPKGTIDGGLSPQATAIKETWEETGLKVEIVDFIGDYDRKDARARYYLAKRVTGTPMDAGWETHSVKLVTFDVAAQLLNSQVDKSVLAAALSKWKG